MEGRKFWLLIDENFLFMLRCSSHLCCIIQLNLKMTEEIRVWTQQECMIQQKDAKKTNNLKAQKMIKCLNPISYLREDQISFKRNEEQKCQDRYASVHTSNYRVQQWTIQQERLLMQLHNQKGNKWVQIARLLHRTDNSVKNHYHSKLRKALRKINKCLTDHMKTQCRPLKNNLLSRVIQTAQVHYTDADIFLKEEATIAYKLKNDILAFAQFSQQQITQQQIAQIRKLVSQISEFNKKFKRQDKTVASQRMTSNKYKGKEIISLLSENSGKNNVGSNRNNQKQNSESFRAIDEEEYQEERAYNQIIVSDATNSKTQSVQMLSHVGLYNPFETFYIFNEQIYPIYFSIYPQTSPNLFSGKTSSFTYYVPENEKIFEQTTWTSIPRIETEFGKHDNSNEVHLMVNGSILSEKSQ